MGGGDRQAIYGISVNMCEVGSAALRGRCHLNISPNIDLRTELESVSKGNRQDTPGGVCEPNAECRRHHAHGKCEGKNNIK